MATYVRLGADDGSPSGLLAAPDSGAPAPAVIVTSAIAGLNDYIGRIVDRLAGDGYVAFGLDYYARTGGPPDLSSMERIMAAVADLSDPQVIDDLRAAIELLRARPETTGRVASLGFCIGGTYALLASAEVDGLACAVAFYGMLRYAQTSANKPASPLDAAARARCPLLGHFGERDHLVPAGDVDELRRVTGALPAEIYSYPGAGHAFHEDFRPQVHRPVAAEEAWHRTATYLRYYLTSEHVEQA